MPPVPPRAREPLLASDPARPPAAAADTSPVDGPAAVFHGTLDVRLDLPLASAGSRAAAQIIDGMASMGVGLMVMAAVGLGGIVGTALGSEDMALYALVLGLVLMFLLQWGWFFAFEWLWEGQTPGKRLLGLRVVTDEGAPPGLWASLVRNLLRLVDLVPATYGIGVLAVLLSKRGKRLGDLAAGTVVVREDTGARTDVPALPDGLPAEAAALLLRWHRRAPTLRPGARAELAPRLHAHLRTLAPDVVPDTAPDLPAEDALAALLRAPAAPGGQP